MTPLQARSLLFVPGDRPDRFDKAVASGADAVILDLEDAVASDAKSAALEHVLSWLGRGNAAVVRVNAAGTAWHAAEIAALAHTGALVMVPKSDSIEDLARVQSVIGDRIIALVETARGVQVADEVCAAPGVVRVALGNVDLARELGVDPDSHMGLSYARGRLVAAAAAAGISASVDGVTTKLDSSEALARDLAVTRELGFGGKLCIHPRQVAAVNDALRPTPVELDWARRIMEHATEGGVSVVDGAMVDGPVVARAAALLQRER
jgi:citrate lyase subunit beta/citryl-CoA lyase